MCCKKQLQYFSISIKTSVLIFQLNNSFQSKNKPNASLYFLVLSELPQLRRTQNYSGVSPLTEERGLSSPRASSCCPLVTWGVIATAQPSTVERGISFDFRREFHKRRRGKNLSVTNEVWQYDIDESQSTFSEGKQKKNWCTKGNFELFSPCHIAKVGMSASITAMGR